MEFAQSREDDDLFADEFEPVAAPTVIEEAPVKPASNNVSATEVSTLNGGANPVSPIGHSNTHNHRNNNRDRGGERKRGARTRGGSSSNGINSSRFASQEPEPVIATSSTEPPAANEQLPTGPSEIPDQSPIEPNPQPNKPIPSVRGDRSLTGGPSHKKLTEEELTAKLERMKIINAEKSESFRKSEKDREGYAEKEKEEKRKRKQEMETRRVMEGERLKNRERKLKAMGGREWDEGKDENGFEENKGRSSQYVRGGHGGVIRGRGGLMGSRYHDGSEEDGYTGGYSGGYDNYRGGRGSGRGRGRGNGRGGGRGAAEKQVVPAPEDFPSLPTPSAPMNPPKSDPKSPLAGAGDWAEEMATPVEEKTGNA